MIKHSLLVAALLTLCVEGAISVCVPPPLKIGRVCGRTVTDDRGVPKPIPGAKVILKQLGGGKQGWEIVTDEEGLFVIDGVPSGRYALTASHSNFVSFSVELEIAKKRG